jgi:four helix bundle protein
VAANIVEGQASNSKKDFLSFLNIANRSLVEAEYLLETVLDLGYLTKERFIELEDLRCGIGNLLNGLMRSIKAKLDT